MNRYHLLLAALVGACAYTTSSVPIAYTLSDLPDRKGIEVSYINRTRQMLCLSPSQWPNAAGKLNQASDQVFLLVDGVQYPIEDFNTGYCSGGCPIYVAPGERVSAFIPYSEFKLPAGLNSKPKSLQFSPNAYPCQR